MTRLGIVTGLVIEAARVEAAYKALAGPEKPLIGAAGGSAERAAEIAGRHVDSGAQALVSFGVAGGLDPSLSPGNIVVGTSVWQVANRTRIETTLSWTRQFAAALGPECGVIAGVIAGSDMPVATAAAKSALHQESEALAVDMESHGVARVAAAADIPLLVIRAIADPATRAIPPAALVGMGPDGRQRPMAVLGKLFARPQDLSGVMRLARDSSAALHSLSLAAKTLWQTGKDRPPGS